MVAGSYLDGEQSSGLVIGDELAKKLKVRVGSKVVLMAQAVHPPDEYDQNGGGGEIQSGLFRVVGIFHTGLRELDAYLVHLALPGSPGLSAGGRSAQPDRRFLASGQRHRGGGRRLADPIYAD